MTDFHKEGTTLIIDGEDGTEEIPINNVDVTIDTNFSHREYRCRSCGTTYNEYQSCTHCIATDSVATTRVL